MEDTGPRGGKSNPVFNLAQDRRREVGCVVVTISKVKRQKREREEEESPPPLGFLRKDLCVTLMNTRLVAKALSGPCSPGQPQYKGLFFTFVSRVEVRF